ncbi:aromatic-amino-acid transaminase [Geosporobacter subterraneus DSM 17957]|uniref:Aromatic-amino-acid transaminase n=1 Tax=Geosporobacter subterraneus DSM 17957 TaxID=1121919 RepID=A0A1M6NQZ8_9FIRM|nr:aminotransferase class I/II-fold pyridoxal phosphate-dependent enzyme [Geosporobacter subterraneus]SHJ98143.1 aromatic-amino-acid transaminase [Geosporobacter subterraneus DSM 17957]
MSTNFSMVAAHSRRPAGEDNIFAINNAAQQAAKVHGADKVVNASVGALLDDDGKLSILPSVIELLKSLPAVEYAAYAPIAGLPSFLEASKKAVFRDQMPEGYIEAIATPGGSGAIRHTIWNYSNGGDYILTPDWYWGPYKTIAEEHGRAIATYTLFDEKDQFNLQSFADKVEELLKKQDQLVILLNSPANNPTGYSLTNEEWEAVLNYLKKEASSPEKKITLFVDIAYIDFAGETNECRSFMKQFGGLPENILTIMAFSMSKGYTLYGMRCGAMICVSANKAVAEEFKAVNQFSNRGVWSNGTRPAMTVLAQIFESPQLLTQVEKERNTLQQMLSERAEVFLENARKANLKICPYKAGFFITIPCSNPEAVTKELQKDLIFAVPMGKGIRFAVCSVPKDQCAIVPEKLAQAIAKFE